MFNHIILATIIAILCSGVLIVGLTTVVIDPYIKATNWGLRLFEFYENNHEKNKIYFIGDSLTVHGVDPVVIENSLLSNNLSFKVYNLGTGADLPLERIVELISIAESKPEIVIICFDNSWFADHEEYFKDWFLKGGGPENRFLLASDKIELDSFTRSLFNKTELNHIQMDPLHLIAYKRRFLIPGLQLTISNNGLTQNNPILDLEQFDLFLRKQFEKSNESVAPFSSPCWYPLSDEDNRNRKALRHIVTYLKERGIHVILVNMPLCPYIEKCRNNSKIFSDFAKTTGCQYYDLESFCSVYEFKDSLHANYAGSRNISKEMEDILLVEARNVTE